MIFGDPYRFAIWIEHIPHWGDSIKNGLFYFFLNGSMYPDDIRTSTLFVDFGGKVSELVDHGERRVWKDIKHPVIEDITMEKIEIDNIISNFKVHATSLLQIDRK